MISVTDLKKQYSGTTLFDGVGIKFKSGCRYGLIGANGSGKSTFMKILAGIEDTTKGEVSLDKGVRLGFLRQDHYEFEEETILNTVMQGHEELWKIMSERNTLYEKENMTDEEGIRSTELEMAFADLEGYTAESRASELLEGLGIPTSKHEMLLKTLTGGFKLRVLLARVLFGNPDVLLLDEPTNHLDLDTIRWLENFLLKHIGIMIVISHDRHFLNSICTHIADLDYNQIRIYTGNYDDYMEASTMAREQEVLINEKKKNEVSRLKEFVNRFSANAARSKQATARLKMIDKIKIENIKPSSRKSPYIRFKSKKVLGDKVAVIENVSKGFGGFTLFKNVSFTIDKKDRIAIIGNNGIGKTTFLKTLIGELKPDHGKIVLGDTVDIQYFSQDPSETLFGDMTLLDWLKQFGPKGITEEELRGLLGRMLFRKEDVFKNINVLSGGEKARAIISKMIMLEGNVLILDEPTNHLDLESIEALNYALEIFDGPIIFVAHDRQFVSSLATRIVEITPGKMEFFLGNYDDYLRTVKNY